MEVADDPDYLFLGKDHRRPVVFATRMFGQELYCFKNAVYMSKQQDERCAEHGSWKTGANGFLDF